MSANLFNGRTRPEALADALDRVRPHVVACQELAPNAAEVIADRYPHGVLDPRDDHWGGGIACLREVEISQVPLTARDGWSARLDDAVWPEIDRSLAITSFHFSNPVDRPIRTSLAERRGQVRDALSHAASQDVPHLIVGDFNSTPIWPAYRRLTEHVEDGVVASGNRQRTWGPWWWFPRVLRIDHAFVRGVRVESTQLIRIKGMDHSALVVDVKAAGL